uniref:Uncharacterized protein n=1 Tax=Manihot esculenta TaxID=3983 RepID=A0A2C9VUT6_MANES
MRFFFIVSWQSKCKRKGAIWVLCFLFKVIKIKREALSTSKLFSFFPSLCPLSFSFLWVFALIGLWSKD